MDAETPIPALAYELQPGKIYLLEVDRAKVSREAMERLTEYCKQHLEITLLVMVSTGGDGIRLVPPPQEVPNAG